MTDVSRTVRTNRLELTACTTGLLLAVCVLATVGDGSTRSVVGLLGLALIVAGAGLVTLDAWLWFPRPQPRVVDGGTRFSGVVSGPVAMVLVAGGLTLIAVSFLLASSLDDVSQGRRGGWVYVVVIVAPVLLAGAVALLVRRDQVVLTPDALVCRRLGRTRAVRWDDVRTVAPVADDPGLSVDVGAADGSALRVPTRQLAVAQTELMAIVRHLAVTPADRARLATVADAGRPPLGWL